MAARTANRGPDTDTASAELLAEGELTPEQRLAEYFGSAANDVSVGIYEVDPQARRKPSFLFSIAADNAPPPHELMAEILAKWGPGEYEALGQDANGKICFKARFTVGSQRERRRAMIPSRSERDSSSGNTAADAGGAGNTPAPAPGVPPELTAILNQQTRLLEQLTSAIGGLQQQPQQRDTLEIARELAQLKDLFTPPAPTQNILETAKDLFALRDQLGGGESENPLVTAIKTLGPAITNAVDKLSETQQAQRAAAIKRAAAAGTQDSEPAATAQPGASENGHMRSIGALLNPVLDMAQQNAAPEQAAQWVLEQLSGQPPYVANVVLDFINDEEVGARLAQIDPRAVPYREWLERVVDAVLTAVDQQQPGDAGGAAAQPGEGESEHASAHAAAAPSTAESG